MTAHRSDPALLTLLAARLLGYADTARVAARAGLPDAEAREHLLDFQAYGWVTRAQFAGSSGWAVTDAGRARNEAQLHAELAAVAGAQEAVSAAYAGFAPLNARVLDLVTAWQLRRLPDGRTLPNEHDDPQADARILRGLAAVHARMVPLLAPAAAQLARFASYPRDFGAAVAAAELGDAAWIDGVEVESAHTVWMQLHQDLLLTLGLRREDVG